MNRDDEQRRPEPVSKLPPTSLTPGAESLGAPDPVEFTRTRSDVERFQRGDSRAFDSIWDRYQPALELLIAARVRPRLSADLRARIEPEDILQNAALKIREKLHEFSYRGPGSVLAWMTAIVQHVVNDMIDYWRAELRDPRREQAVVVGEATSESPVARVAYAGRGPETEANLRDLRHIVAQSLERLSERQQTIVIWKFFGGVTWDEIAMELGAKSGDAVRMEFNGKILPFLARLMPKPA